MGIAPVQAAPGATHTRSWTAHDTQFGDVDIRKAVAEGSSGHGLPLKCILADDDLRMIATTAPIYNGDRDLAAEEENAGLLAAAPAMQAALRLFIKQWNACGPNSDFGRYFSNVRDAAVAAIAKTEVRS